MRGLLPTIVAVILYLALVLIAGEISLRKIGPVAAAIGGAAGGWIIARHAPDHVRRWVAVFVVIVVAYTLYPIGQLYYEGRQSYVNALLLSALLTIVAASIAAYLQRVAAPAPTKKPASKKTASKKKRR